MKILITAFGSHGDVLPFIAIGRELQQRGHYVKLYSTGYFERYAAEAGLPFQAIASADTYDRLIRHPDIENTFKGFRLFGRALTEILPVSYRALEADLEPGNTILVGSLLAFSVRSIQEKYGTPATIVHLHSTTFRSRYKQARATPLPAPNKAPTWVKRLVYYALDTFFFDPCLGNTVNQHRKEVGLPPVKRLFDQWIHGADALVGLFPSWFTPPQEDWPANLCMTGFPLYDHQQGQVLPSAVQAFLDAGPPPIAFTAGTATANVKDFFATSIQACKRIGRRAILLTTFSDQLPSPLPDHVAHFDYVPFGLLLPRLAAFVHHGGIGSTSQAMYAGVPQLIRPFAYDQFDNASNVMRLGVGDELLPFRYRPRLLAKKLDQLLRDESVKTNCRIMARRLANNEAIDQTADIILDTAKHMSPVPATSGRHVGNGKQAPLISSGNERLRASCHH